MHQNKVIELTALIDLLTKVLKFTKNSVLGLGPLFFFIQYSLECEVYCVKFFKFIQ